MRMPGARFWRFVAVGAINTALTYALFVGAQPALGHLLAYTLAYAFGIVLSYLLNAWFVFRTRTSWHTAMAFPMVYVVQYLWGLGALYLLVDLMAWPGAVAMLAVIGSSVPLTYLLTRWVMREHGVPPRRGA